eukprot:SAG31_NODE_3569_length_4116_cov_652.723923_3_plen_139_part_00
MSGQEGRRKFDRTMLVLKRLQRLCRKERVCLVESGQIFSEMSICHIASLAAPSFDYLAQANFMGVPRTPRIAHNITVRSDAASLCWPQQPFYAGKNTDQHELQLYSVAALRDIVGGSGNSEVTVSIKGELCQAPCCCI